MKLFELTPHLQPSSIQGSTDIEITGMTEDSRMVQKGSLFFAHRGYTVSGLDFISEAIQKGAAAIITDEKVSELPVPCLIVPSIGQAESKYSAHFYGYPTRQLNVIGVTGTNGKTTFTYLLEAVAREAGLLTGVIGTINYRLPSSKSGKTDILKAPNTTPNALEVQRIFSLFRERKSDLAIMEVSSHALSLGRVEDVEFDCGVFTNLTQDHLDFHKNMEQYFEAKQKLFKMLGAKDSSKIQSKIRCEHRAIINMDDPYGKKMTESCSVPTLGYGIQSDTDLIAKKTTVTAQGSRFQLMLKDKSYSVKTHLIGHHNVYNVLSCIGAGLQLQIPIQTIIQGIEKVKSVPGRLEPIQCGQNFSVLVDYAHTEDALKNVLESLRLLPRKRLITLFGCGGDRDRSKRPLMGATAAELSDYVIITSDNPRSEDPSKIVLDIEVGLKRNNKTNYEIIIDREKAIDKIIQMAQKDDIILLAGKGHENYQIFSNQTIHLDDSECAEKSIKNKHI